VDFISFDDEEGGDQFRYGEQSLRGQAKGIERRRSSGKTAYHGKGKRARRNRNGWERFDD
jgi:hypothetical protein